MSTTAAPRSHYQRTIAEILAVSGHLGMDPRHVEAFMRIEYGTLDHLSRERFAALARDCAQDVLAAGPDESETFAVSMGL